MTWRDYRDRIATAIIVLPIGAVDAHGPHLPLSTDTIVSTYLAAQLEQRLDVLVLPAVPYGRRTDPTAGGGRFPGATSIRARTLTDLVLDVLTASHRHGANRFLILESHMANLGAVREATDVFMDRAPGVRVMVASWWDLVSEETRNDIAAETGVGRHDDHHAAMVETSLVMQIAPDLVRHDLLGDDVPARRARYLILPPPDALSTQTGVVYRASRASAAIGERVLREVVANLTEAVRLELVGEGPGATS